MITKLSKNNIQFFETLIPIDELDNLISRPDYFGIGVTRYEGTEEIPAGVMIYRLMQDPTDLMPASLDIQYLYVTENQRHRCVGSDLVCKLFDVAVSNKIETITVNTLADDEQDGLRKFLAGWSFNFVPGYSHEFYSPIREIDLSSVILKVARKKRMPVSSLSTVSPGQFNEFKNELRKKNTEGIDSAFYEMGMDYYDKEVSKVIQKDGRVLAAILVHRNIGGLLVVDMVTWLPPVGEVDLMGLIAVAHESAQSHYTSDVYISGTVRTEFGANLVDEVLPEHSGVPVFRGILTKDGEVTPEDWMGAKEIMTSVFEGPDEEEGE